MLDECTCVFLSTCVKIQTSCVYKAAIAVAKCAYLGLSRIYVVYVFDLAESLGSCADEIVVVM